MKAMWNLFLLCDYLSRGAKVSSGNVLLSQEKATFVKEISKQSRISIDSKVHLAPLFGRWNLFVEDYYGNYIINSVIGSINNDNYFKITYEKKWVGSNEYFLVWIENINPFQDVEVKTYIIDFEERNAFNFVSQTISKKCSIWRLGLDRFIFLESRLYFIQKKKLVELYPDDIPNVPVVVPYVYFAYYYDGSIHIKPCPSEPKDTWGVAIKTNHRDCILIGNTFSGIFFVEVHDKYIKIILWKLEVAKSLSVVSKEVIAIIRETRENKIFTPYRIRTRFENLSFTVEDEGELYQFSYYAPINHKIISNKLKEDWWNFVRLALKRLFPRDIVGLILKRLDSPIFIEFSEAKKL